MTAPFADVPRLHAIAGWDVPQVRRAVAGLAGTVEPLLTWRVRLEGVGRALESGDCWSGPAARSAVAALAEVSAVSSAIGRALEASLSAYETLVAEAARAQDLAEETLAWTGLLQGMPGIGPPPAADVALRHAALVARAAEEADEALTGLGVRDASAPADFGDLLTHIPIMGPVQAPRVPSGQTPAEAADWWAGLSSAQQRALISMSPAVVGGLDGVPAWARDRANRLLLDRALRDPRTSPASARTAGVVVRRIRAEEAAGHHVQLQLLDLAGDRVALALGDLDTADDVAVLVPGVGNTPADDLGRLVSSARRVSAATRAAAPGETVATLVWLGYDPPDNLFSGALRLAAWDGAPALAGSLAGLAAARTATATGDARTTVVAHSYGTVVVDEAADMPGRLAADAVVLLGSPGMEADAASLEAPEVFNAMSPADPIVWYRIGRHGVPATAFYGSTALPVAAAMGHSDYFDPEFPTVGAVGEVVAGRRRPD